MTYHIDTSTLTPIPLNAIAQYSHWPARIMGLAQWHQPNRTTDKIEKEYNKDKYARLLAYVEANPSATIADVLDFAYGGSQSNPILVSVKDAYFEMTAQHAYDTHIRVILEAVRNHQGDARTLVELGCGYGINLWKLQSMSEQAADCAYIGGEFAANAVKMGNKLLESHAIRLHRFDFYDRETYRFLADVTGPVTIYTAHAIEQIPGAQAIFDNLRAYREHIQIVVHIEPLYDLHTEPTLTDLLRRRYSEINDYNRDLLALVEAADDIEIITLEKDVFGYNPFNASSILAWRFK
ncbi:MAG: hypothetical protein ACOCXZ_00535 [Chloroflexota bacterium]